MLQISSEQTRYFRDNLRQARALAQQDAEAFHSLLFAFEQLGSVLHRRNATLYKYTSAIEKFAAQSPLAEEVPRTWRSFHTPFSILYDLLTDGRNKALHQGAYARHLAAHAIELSLVLEDAMNARLSATAGDYMVREPVCAAMWHPLSFVRRSMLLNSFSYLPLLDDRDSEPKWTLLSDLGVASYLRQDKDNDTRLSHTVEVALKSSKLALLSVQTVRTSTSIKEILGRNDPHPVLVLSDDEQYLLGILTPFDLL